MSSTLFRKKTENILTIIPVPLCRIGGQGPTTGSTPLPVDRAQHCQYRQESPDGNGLNQNLRTNNPNEANPFRLDRSQALTCDMDHGYTAEQQAFDTGLMDKFVQHTGATYSKCDPKQVMGYYDGNTVTAIWNYAQRYAMSDNSIGTTFGPSTPGAVNLVSGQTAGATPANIVNKHGTVVVASGTIVSDLDPTFDDCSSGPTAALTGKNVGDLLNAKGVTWGWFEGGFTPTATKNGKAVCRAKSTNIGGASITDYIPHHEPFQYYASTANPHHLPPTSVPMTGHTDQAHRQYDLSAFFTALDSGNMPAVSFLKAKAYQDGHAGYSDPLAGSIASMFDFTDPPHTGDFLLDPVTGEPTTSVAAAAATTLSVQQSGTLASNSGGAFATYEIVQPSGAALTLTLSVGPHTAVAAHQIGIDVYQGGALLGHVTPTSTSLGDAISNAHPRSQ
ncbi:MAG: hypothetical protein M1118_07250 [Chloroflexi bacterium]|nr:hypothetical protein [Chloroflexota bacterium]